MSSFIFGKSVPSTPTPISPLCPKSPSFDKIISSYNKWMLGASRGGLSDLEQYWITFVGPIGNIKIPSSYEFTSY